MVIERSYRASIEDVWSLWTTKEGFESWWGPQGFRVEVHALEAHDGGALHYDMIADSPETVAAMKGAGQPVSHPTRSRFTEVKPHERLVVTSVIDFLPGVEPYESSFSVDFTVTGDTVRMVVTLSPMHSTEVSSMQKGGFESQLGKLDTRFA
ncbi:MAG: SRPBCC domain-containing protein [Proteobacteria bacterium]|nr:MAG: SRPBCC domain-containing protein [Pseudomonadota bacterium]